MALWDFFKLTRNVAPQKLEGLAAKVVTLLPDLDDQTQAKIAAMSGLLACVANSDFHVCSHEQAEIAESLKHWCKLEEGQAQAVAKIALEEVAALASLDVHQYTKTLESLLNDEEKVGLLETLFQLAASDGEVEHEESEFIRHISHGLRLSHHEFIAARATVMNHLSLLKS